MRLEDVHAQDHVDGRLAFEGKGLIHVQQVHRVEGAAAGLHFAEAQGDLQELVNIELRAAGSAPFHLDLLEREPQLAGARQTYNRASRPRIDENSHRLSIQRTGGMKVPDAAARKRDGLEMVLREKIGESHKCEILSGSGFILKVNPFLRVMDLKNEMRKTPFSD